MEIAFLPPAVEDLEYWKRKGETNHFTITHLFLEFSPVSHTWQSIFH